MHTYNYNTLKLNRVCQYAPPFISTHNVAHLNVIIFYPIWKRIIRVHVIDVCGFPFVCWHNNPLSPMTQKPNHVKNVTIFSVARVLLLKYAWTPIVRRKIHSLYWHSRVSDWIVHGMVYYAIYHWLVENISNGVTPVCLLTRKYPT